MIFLFLSEHLAPNAPQEVNINDTIRTKIIKLLNNPNRYGSFRRRFNLKTFSSLSEIFLEAEKHIVELMKKNSYPRFIQSEQYRNLLQNASNPVPKKTYDDAFCPMFLHVNDFL